MVVAQLVNLYDPNLVLLLARLNAGRLPALDLTAEKLLAGSLMAQSLMDSKVGKLQSVEHFVSDVACEAFCADSVCCVFSVSILVLQGASRCFYVAAESAALFLGNYVSAAETVSLAAGTPAVAAGNWAAAAWAEFETENVELSLSHIHSLSQKDHRKKPELFHLVRKEGWEGSALDLAGLPQEAVLGLGGHHRHHGHHQQRRHPLHH